MAQVHAPARMLEFICWAFSRGLDQVPPVTMVVFPLTPYCQLRLTGGPVLVVAPHQMACRVTRLMVSPDRPLLATFQYSVWFPFSLAIKASPQTSVPVLSVQLPERAALA